MKLKLALKEGVWRKIMAWMVTQYFIYLFAKIWDGRFEMSVKDETQPFERFPNILSAFSLMLIYWKNVLNKALPKPTNKRISFSIRDVIGFYPAVSVFNMRFFFFCRNRSTAVSPKMKVSAQCMYFFTNELNSVLKRRQTQTSHILVVYFVFNLGNIVQYRHCCVTFMC